MPDLAPVLAVIGGGQLARMMAEPAAALGLPLRLLAEAPGVSAAQVIPDQRVGDHTDLADLRAVTAGCVAVTFDHEHVPTEHLRALESDGLPVRPGPDALVHAQDKIVMRERLVALGLPLRLLAGSRTSSAAQVIGDVVLGAHTDLDDLRRTVEGAVAVTFDHEHVPTEHLRALRDDGLAVRPGPEALVHAQDKIVMRERLGALGVPCPRNAVVAGVEDVEAFGFPCVLKTSRGG